MTNRHGCARLYGSGSEAPKRCSTLPLIAPKLKRPESPPPLGDAKPVVRRVASKLMTKNTQLSTRIPYVAGDCAGIKPPSERLAAARENLKFAPHWWQCVAPTPTSDRQAGQIWGRPCLPRPKIPLILLKSDQATGEGGITISMAFLARMRTHSYNTEITCKQIRNQIAA